ncbi:insulinase family protein [Simkania negevensis]|uniref:Presequence protease, mitochondrial n=1 Tax=Simkania negevensis (strain ATCC VR-1471 / DSM 27360 / Z) TaxID=331113 RepID=F8L9K3_SIMNZ|nr:insulinase family protein [Simkania negevensis]CCB89540.1 presequence protease, mitochondrial [Simkania negevensis Z]
MNLTPIYQVGDTHGEFTVTKVLPIEELQVVLYELKHNLTGAQVIHLASDDHENLFCISFRTLPTDSTGVAHILEHTVLCGSKKYPVKDPFFSMSRRSLNTFMNAMTGSDFTCYPAASQVEKDFYNLLSVYLDAVFFPELKELSFMQEGHRLEFEQADDPTSPLLFKGVVFNEMKGSLSSPETRLWQGVMERLTPDLTYAFNSGGDPVEIPSLTYEGLKNFHGKFYHPSHALFFFYGNFPLDKHLDMIEKHALKGIQKTPDLQPIPHQKRFVSPRKDQMFYPLKEEDLKKKTYIAFAWLTAELKNQQDALALAVIDSILMETDASPLKHAILKSELCTQVDGYLDTDMSEIPYAIICRGADLENAEGLEKVLFETLKDLVAKGIDEKHLEAAIHQLEFSRLEITGDYGPFGLTLFMRSALAKQHGCPPENALMVYNQFHELQEKVKDPRYLTGLIQKYLIDNTHFLRLVMEPSATLDDEEAEEEKERLKRIQEALSKEAKERIVQQAAELQKFQEKTEKQSIECLPKIELVDVPKDVPDFPLRHEQQDQLSVFIHECFTNHIVYADLIFDLPKVTLDELPYLQLLVTLLPELGVGDRDYTANLEYINSYLGGFSATLQMHPQITDSSVLKPSFGFRGKALERNTDKLFSLFLEICHSPRFDEKERIKELILQLHTAQQNRLNRQAISYAIQQSLAPLSSSGTIGQKMQGLDYFKFIRDLVKDIDQKLPQLQEKLRELCNRLFHFNIPHLVLSIDAKQHHYLADHRYFGLGDLPSKPLDLWEQIPPVGEKKPEGRIISTPVAFSAWGFKTCTALHTHAPSLSLATNLMENTYLHQKIREQGGAYGAGVNYSPLTGHFYFYSYRDPHIASTYNAFKAGLERIANGDFSSRELEEAKLGLIQDSDTPISPGSRAIVAYSQFREGRTKKVRQDFRDHVLSIDKKEVKEAVKQELQAIADQGLSVTLANEKLLAKENEKLSPRLSILPI